MIRSIHKTKRLILRPLRLRDYSVWFDAMVNRLPLKNEWDAAPKKSKECSLSAYKKVLKRHFRLAKDDDYYWYGVFEKKSGALIGQIDFKIFIRGNQQSANFGYQIYNRHWGKGFGQEASIGGLKIGFQKLKINRLEAAINLHNKKSIRLAKAIGMKREGIKKRYWYENGKWVDHLIYAANPEDIGLSGKKPFLK